MISIMSFADILTSALPAKAFHRKSFPEGGVVFRQGQPSIGPGVTQRGGVELTRHTENGVQVRLQRARAGDSFAEAAIFSDVFHCDCLASPGSEIMMIDRAQIVSALETQPRFAIALARHLATQVQAQRHQRALMAIRGAEERVLAAVTEGWLKTTVQDLAVDIALTPEATYRALAALVRRGTLERPARGQYRLAGRTG